MTTAGKHAREGRLNKKKRIIAAATAAMCCALMAGGTLAYFTAEERAHNVITSGGVDIELNEYTIEDGERVAFPEGGIDGIMPGISVDKIVEVENTGASPAWVRIWVGMSFRAGEDPLDPSVMGIEMLDGWIQGSDGWWYYDQKLEPGETTSPLFEEVTFSVGMGNAYMNGEAAVNVFVEAVQSDNNGNVVSEAQGWPTVDELSEN